MFPIRVKMQESSRTWNTRKLGYHVEREVFGLQKLINEIFQTHHHLMQV